jgi:hypothetical protein
MGVVGEPGGAPGRRPPTAVPQARRRDGHHLCHHGRGDGARRAPRPRVGPRERGRGPHRRRQRGRLLPAPPRPRPAGAAGAGLPRRSPAPLPRQPSPPGPGDLAGGEPRPAGGVVRHRRGLPARPPAAAGRPPRPRPPRPHGAGRPDGGYCAAQRERLVGGRWHLVPTADGVPVACTILPAAGHAPSPSSSSTHRRVVAGRGGHSSPPWRRRQAGSSWARSSPAPGTATRRSWRRWRTRSTRSAAGG